MSKTFLKYKNKCQSNIGKNFKGRKGVAVGTAPTLQYRPSGGIIKRILETRLKETIAEVQQSSASNSGSSSGANSSTLDSRCSNATSRAARFAAAAAAAANQNGPSANLLARRSVVKMLMLCVGLFFCCYTPMVAYFLWG